MKYIFFDKKIKYQIITQNLWQFSDLKRVKLRLDEKKEFYLNLTTINADSILNQSKKKWKSRKYRQTETNLSKKFYCITFYLHFISIAWVSCFHAIYLLSTTIVRECSSRTIVDKYFKCLFLFSYSFNLFIYKREMIAV